MSKTVPVSSNPSDLETAGSFLSPSFTRLARYVYAADLTVGKRVLDLGCSDGEGAALLLDRGAQSVLGFDLDQQAVSRGQSRQNPRLKLRTATAEQLFSEGGLLRLCAGLSFDVIFVSGDRQWLTAPGFLSALRWLLGPQGHLLWATASREALPNAPGAVGYFELTDALEAARLGPVMMLGQSPFFASALAPFGVEQPSLVLDDTLAQEGQSDEYVAVCGPGSGKDRPYEVVRLPRQSVSPRIRIEKQEVRIVDPQVARERDKLASELATIQRERDGFRDKWAEQRVQLDKATAHADSLQAHADRLQAHADRVQAQHDKLQVQLDRTAAQHRDLETQLGHANERLKKAEDARQKSEDARQKSEDARQKAEAARLELAERERQRSLRESEVADAAVLHEKQMRELRTAIEERDAFVAELEEQARELPLLQERLQKAEQRAEEAAASERQARHKLAEAEGLLLRQKTQLAEQQRTAALPETLDARQRDLEAARRENLVAQAELEERAHALSQKDAALQEALKSFEQKQANAAQREEAQKNAEAATIARVEADRNKLLLETQVLRGQLSERDERLQNLEQRLEAAVRAEKRLDDGVPQQVGDIPTAPVVITAHPSRSQELPGVQARNAELEAEVLRLKEKVSEAEREAWKQIKARSEAETAAAEVREDTVRKLRDARKLASVEMTRAMEEATKKAVALKEELGRTDAERRDALVQTKQLAAERDAALEQVQHVRAEMEALRWASADGQIGSVAESEMARLHREAQAAVLSLRAENARLIEAERLAQRQAEAKSARALELEQTVTGLEQAVRELREKAESSISRRDSSGEIKTSELHLSHELQARERAIVDLKSERDALGRLLSEVEREAFARGERARQLKVALSEKERELESLRVELGDRERKLSQAEQKSAPVGEVRQLEQALSAARRRVEELLAEANRRALQDDEVVATALRERARVERLTEVMGQTARERDEAVHRVSELEQRLGGALSECEKLRTELARTPNTD